MNKIFETHKVLIIFIILFLGISPLYALTTEPGKAIKSKLQGDAYYNACRYSEALECYTKGLDLAQKEENKKIYNACLGNIGNIYGVIEDYNRCLFYYKKGYSSAIKEKDTEMQSKFVINLVIIYCFKKEPANAKIFFRKQMLLPMKNIKIRRYFYLYNQGLIAQTEKKYSEAEFYLKQAIEYTKEAQMGSTYEMTLYNQLGDLYLANQQPRKAIDILKKSKKLIDNSKNKEYIGAYKELSNAYKCIKNYKQAEIYHNRYLILSDSIFNQNQFNIANSKLFDYENKINDEKINALIYQNNTQLVVICLFVLYIISLSTLYFMLRRKTKKLLSAQKLLIDKNEELSKSDKKQKKLLTQYINSINTINKKDIEKTEDKKERNDIGLNQEQINRLLDKITTVMENIQIISCSDFNLNQLADLVESNTKYVSWIINDTYGKNFKSFLNKYRIQEACKRLSDTEH